MSPKQMNADERDLLLDSLLDGSIDEADLLRIEAELSVDSEVRRQYYRRLKLALLLEREAKGSGQATDRRVGSEKRWGNPAAMLAGVLIGLAASLLLALVLLPWAKSPNASTSIVEASPTVEPSASGFAVLKGQSGAVWADQSIVVGDLLPQGELHLISGQVHVEFFSGVQMVIEGESRFTVDSPMQVTIKSGLARASVPEPARGFAVKTESGDIIDLGTEFAIKVGKGGSDVRVLDGEVELRPRASDPRTMLGGSALRLDQSGNIAAASGANLDLISPGDFEAMIQTQQQDRVAGWQEATTLLRSDPRLIAFYQFSAEDLKSRQVRNLAGDEKAIASDGAVVAAEYAVDRWGRAGEAFDFSRLGSRVRVDVPGQHRGLTLNCWVKINSLDRWYNSLFLTDGHGDREPHWQIMDDGRVFFSVKVPPPNDPNVAVRQHEFYSPSIWGASLSGRWIMLSVTYDVDARVVTHYLNGVAISSEAIPEFALIESIQIGEASICNWSEPMYRTDAQFVVRNLNGSMDEFAIYSGSLSAEEILKLYRVGNPNDL